MNNRILVELFASGVLLGAGPCLITCGPILLSYLAGTKKTIARSVGAYVLFSCARITAYLFLSIVFFWSGKAFTEALLGGLSRYVVMLLGVVLLLLGILILFDVRGTKDHWCAVLSRHFIERDKKSIVVLGLCMGLIPCGPFLAVFSYIGLVAKAWQASLVYSLLFGLGTVLSPLVLLAIAAGSLPKLIMRYPGYYRLTRIFSGSILMWLGIRSFMAGFQL